MASTVDLTNLVAGVQDPHWQHSASTWFFDIAMLLILALLFATFVRWRLRRKTEA
jgi:hypothetical protein